MAGCAETVAFCREHDLPHQVTGKLVVATEPEELPRMAELARRGAGQRGRGARAGPGRDAQSTSRTCAGIAALYVPSTGVCDYRLIAEKLGELVAKEGGELHLGRAVRRLVPPARRRGRAHRRAATCWARRWWPAPGCAATSWPGPPGADPGVRILPFRGEYSGLLPPADDLVRGLIYPVPDPAFPFLGVHATRGIDGTVHAGPNAVLALAREGYSWGTVRPRELARSLAYPGMLRLARQHWRYGLGEVHRSLSRTAMAQQLQRMLPDVRAEHLVPAGRRGARPGGAAGRLARRRLPVRRAGRAEVARPGSVLHVLNAPSPAATAALPIGREILARLTGERLGPLGS